MILGSGALPEIWVQNESSEDGGGSTGRSNNYNNGYRTDVIKMNSNTNSNTGATVTINATSEEAPADGSESEVSGKSP